MNQEVQEDYQEAISLNNFQPTDLRADKSCFETKRFVIPTCFRARGLVIQIPVPLNSESLGKSRQVKTGNPEFQSQWVGRISGLGNSWQSKTLNPEFQGKQVWARLGNPKRASLNSRATGSGKSRQVWPRQGCEPCESADEHTAAEAVKA